MADEITQLVQTVAEMAAAVKKLISMQEKLALGQQKQGASS